MSKKDKSLPYISVAWQPTSVNKTGHWATQQPVLRRGISPCMANCLAGQDVPRWINAVREGNFAEAYGIITATNPFPSLTGRVCPHPCESECNRQHLEGAVAINQLEKFVGDWGLANVPEEFPKVWRREKVAIIGSGPAGLACTYYLRKQGYHATIFEAMPVLGGLLAFGIPEFRLPKTVLKKEVEEKIFFIPDIEVRKSTRINQMIFTTLLSEFDAVFVAVGASRSRKLDLPGQDAPAVWQGVEFLKKANLGAEVVLGKKVIVAGGGNTAMDAARIAARLGSEVTIFYRRTKKEMPAMEDEIRAAEKEGIEIKELAAPGQILTANNQIRVEWQRMALGEPDKTGRRKPAATGEKFFTETDNLILAVGEEVDLSSLPNNWQKNKKIFLGGDALGQAGTVAAAIKSGRENAAAIIGHFTGEEVLPVQHQGEMVQYNLDFLKQCQHFPFQLRAQKNLKKLSQALAQCEAQRCLSCGLCNLCGTCYNFCPDLAIKKKDGQMEIDYNYCKGCGICVEECPARSIVFKREEEK